MESGAGLEDFVEEFLPTEYILPMGAFTVTHVSPPWGVRTEIKTITTPMNKVEVTKDNVMASWVEIVSDGVHQIASACGMLCWEVATEDVDTTTISVQHAEYHAMTT